MNQSITIREIKNNTSELKEFEEKEWRLADIEHYGKPRNFEKKKYKFIANDADGNIVGVLDLITEANVSFLEGLLVSHQHRGEGIGTDLLLFAENFAKEKGCTKIWTETDADWKASDFYKEMGYEICGTHEKHYLGKKGLILTKFFEK